MRLRTNEPDLSATSDSNFDREELVYRNVKEALTDYYPKPLGNHVVTIIYHNYSLCHSEITGKLVTRSFFCEKNSCRMVLKEASYSWDYYLWIRVLIYSRASGVNC